LAKGCEIFSYDNRFSVKGYEILNTNLLNRHCVSAPILRHTITWLVKGI